MWRRRFVWLVVLALLPFVGAPLLGQAQATTGVIEGIIQSPDGEAVPGVSVTLINTATNYEKTLTTNSAGRFRGVLMPLGPYRVTASLEGFATLVREGIELDLGATVSLSLEMQLSTVEQEILVTAEAPLIESSRSEGQVRIDSSEIENLPNNGRNFLDYTTLTPGVTIVQGPDGDELSISGQRGIFNNVSVDGADFNNPFFGEQRGGQRPPFTFNMDAIEEVLVVSDGAPAEFGRSGSGFVNVVTKSGTNSINGSATLFYTDDNLTGDAKNRDGSNQPPGAGDRTQFGFTLGGPITRDKVFYFVAADVQSGGVTKQTDPTRIEQRVVDFFAANGSPNENGPIDHSDDAEVALGKIDWNASARDLVTFRYAHTNSEQVNGTFDVDSWGRSANGVEKVSSNAGTMSWIRTISDGLLNEFRGQYAKENRPRPYEGPLLPGQDRPMPDIAFDFGRGYRFGMPFFLPVIYNDTRKQFNDNFTILRGNHTIKAGVEYNETASSQTFIGFANSRFIFGSTDGFLNYAANPNYVECSDGSSNFLGTCPAGSDPVGPVLLYLQFAGVGGKTPEQAGTQTLTQKEPAVFVQDTWQPTANLTLDFGLRWEAQIQPDPITPPSEVFFAPFIGQTVTNEFGTFEFPSDGTIPDDKSMFQPRIAVAWDPAGDGRAVVRASAGRYAARIPALMLASSRSTNGSVGQTLFRSSAAAPFLGPVPAWDQQIPASEVGSPFLPEVYVFDKNFENPKTDAFSLSYEREIAPDLALLVKGNYAKTDHLFRMINRNDPVFGCPWSSGLEPGGANGIACDAAGGLHVVESSARSRYQAVTIGLNKRQSNNYAYQIYYTRSDDKSDDDNERDPFSYRYARADTLGPEYGHSDRHQPNRLNAWVLWNLPLGFDLNARYSYRDAQPLSITAAGEPAATPQDRINSDGSITERNLGKKDNKFSSLDVRVTKNFGLGENNLQIILDIFNVFDEANFSRPEVTNLIFNFDGTVQSGSGLPRQFQLGVRFQF